MFYDQEVPHLQADVAAKSDEIDRLRTDVADLKRELAAAEENSAGLATSLEKATHELGESRDALQTQLDARGREMASLTERLDQSRAQLKRLDEGAQRDKEAGASKAREMETSLMASDKRAAELDAELSKANAAKAVSKKLINDLNTQLEGLKRDNAEA